jgi:hypothetical protein
MSYLRVKKNTCTCICLGSGQVRVPPTGKKSYPYLSLSDRVHDIRTWIIISTLTVLTMAFHAGVKPAPSGSGSGADADGAGEGGGDALAGKAAGWAQPPGPATSRCASSVIHLATIQCMVDYAVSIRQFWHMQEEDWCAQIICLGFFETQEFHRNHVGIL